MCLTLSKLAQYLTDISEINMKACHIDTGIGQLKATLFE